jgi:hypothetical protein
MLQVCCDLDFGEESLDAEDRAQLRVQNFQRNFTVVSDVAGEVHGCHAATSDFLVDRIPAGESGGQLTNGIHCVLGAGRIATK